MEPKMITRPAFMVQGLSWVGIFQEGEIPELWTKLMQRVGEIKHIVPGELFGVCSWVEGAPEGTFEYVAGFAVSAVEDLPEGMVVRMIPEQTYAVFTHRGSLGHLKDTYDYINQVWLPKSNYTHTAGPELELYNDNFKDGSDDSEFYIYIPVK